MLIGACIDMVHVSRNRKQTYLWSSKPSGKKLDSLQPFLYTVKDIASVHFTICHYWDSSYFVMHYHLFLYKSLFHLQPFLECVYIKASHLNLQFSSKSASSQISQEHGDRRVEGSYQLLSHRPGPAPSARSARGLFWDIHLRMSRHAQISKLKGISFNWLSSPTHFTAAARPKHAAKQFCTCQPSSICCCHCSML